MASYTSLVFIGVVALSWQVGCEQCKYDNYTLIRLHPSNEDHLKAIMQLESKDGMEVFKGSRGLNDSMDVLVDPDNMEYIKRFARQSNLNLEVKQENYGTVLGSDYSTRTPRRRMRPFNVYEYNSAAAINDFLEAAARRHPELVTLQDIGSSYQGRKMKVAKISSNPGAGNPIILVDAGIHAREWVAPAMAVYLIHRLSHDPEARMNELSGVDWYILPLVNPDGYEYTRQSRAHRLWRKTRSMSLNGLCYGVDGNRNYGFHWGVSGVSKNPCDQETYAGPKPFSEVETRNVRDLMMAYSKRIKLYVSLHSYGQFLVYPWGYTGDILPKDWKKLDTLARQVSNAVQSAGGKPFKVLSAGKWYPAAGGSDDFAFGAVGVPYSYTMELTDGHEFTFPEYQLKIVLPQFYEGFKAFGSNIKREFTISKFKRELPNKNLGNNTTKVPS